jgi:hypothetical protein
MERVSEIDAIAKRLEIEIILRASSFEACRTLMVERHSLGIWAREWFGPLRWRRSPYVST